MKKSILLLVLAAFVVLGITSCATSDQNFINGQFANIYNSYRSNLILSDSTKYTVKSGDTLTGITKKLYGDENGYYFPLMILASSEVVLDPDLIMPGMELTVPNLQKNLNDADARKEMKAFFKDVAGVYRHKKTSSASTTRKELLKIANSL